MPDNVFECTIDCPDCWHINTFSYELTMDCELMVKPFKCSCGYEFTESELENIYKQSIEDLQLSREIEQEEHERTMGLRI